MKLAATVTCPTDASGPCTVSGGLTSDSLPNLFHTAANVLIFLVGAVSVIMIIVAGLRYAASAGNPTATAGAKNTIVYALIGIVVAASAFFLVNFVFKQFGVK